MLGVAEAWREQLEEGVSSHAEMQVWCVRTRMRLVEAFTTSMFTITDKMTASRKQEPWGGVMKYQDLRNIIRLDLKRRLRMVEMKLRTAEEICTSIAAGDIVSAQGALIFGFVRNAISQSWYLLNIRKEVV